MGFAYSYHTQWILYVLFPTYVLFNWFKDISSSFLVTDPKCACNLIQITTKRRNICWKIIFLTYKTNPHFSLDAIAWEYEEIISCLPYNQSIITISINLWIAEKPSFAYTNNWSLQISLNKSIAQAAKQA